ncbi:MAG: Surface lipoprotein-related protein [Candidatus Woesebacteria bacterium GW2011_GWB1_38_5b]|uniref:Surface lipoprotein-related protein n=1 Tax=Candidatus Woesebacteria bacterium GW2011_GWB1_38_5b TaxID=1618569 RepID=A0A0G0N9D3_9BACT|nr:MAG: Surface lipoprotein-related protein [Candidatus Woesebacteria bacterium GW2011_GWB1_38_5b]
METQQVKKWYQKTGGIIALLVLFFPIGLFLMWKYADWGNKTKWIITSAFGLLFVIGRFSGGDDVNKDKTNPQVTTETSQSVSELKPTEAPKPTQHELDATVKFSEDAFLITNNENEDWTSCRFELNSGIIRGGYTYKGEIVAKDALIIPFRDFTKGDGTRFNSYSTKAQNLSISCEVGNIHGFNYFTIN